MRCCFDGLPSFGSVDSTRRPHSNSMVLSDGNAPIYRHKFLWRTKNRRSDPSEIEHLISNENFAIPKIWLPSASISIDLSILRSRLRDKSFAWASEKHRQHRWFNDQRAGLCLRQIRFSHGAKWKALISRYITPIPLSGATWRWTGQSIPDSLPLRIPVKTARDGRGSFGDEPGTGCRARTPRQATATRHNHARLPAPAPAGLP